MKINTGDYIFTPVVTDDNYITANKPYKVYDVLRNGEQVAVVLIKDNDGDMIVTSVSNNHIKSAHLEFKGYWYKLECSIQRRHNEG